MYNKGMLGANVVLSACRDLYRSIFAVVRASDNGLVVILKERLLADDTKILF